MRIALAQFASVADPSANLELVAGAAQQAASQGAELLLCPESTMRMATAPSVEVAEPIDGPWATRLHQIAAENGLTIAAGMYTPAADGRVKNTLRVVGPDVDAAYDKIHLYDAFGFSESTTVAPGSELLVTEVAGIRVGFAICYDIRFPTLFTKLADLGAELICVVASWAGGPTKAEQWELLARARALDSTCFVAAADQPDPASIGIDNPNNLPLGVGCSLVASPLGLVVDKLGAEPGLLVVDIDPAEVAQVRKTLPVLTNRRI